MTSSNANYNFYLTLFPNPTVKPGSVFHSLTLALIMKLNSTSNHVPNPQPDYNLKAKSSHNPGSNVQSAIAVKNLQRLCVCGGSLSLSLCADLILFRTISHI